MTKPDFRLSFFQGSQKISIFLISKKLGEAFLATPDISGKNFLVVWTLQTSLEGMTKPDFRFPKGKAWGLRP